MQRAQGQACSSGQLVRLSIAVVNLHAGGPRLSLSIPSSLLGETSLDWQRAGLHSWSSSPIGVALQPIFVFSLHHDHTSMCRPAGACLQPSSGAQALEHLGWLQRCGNPGDANKAHRSMPSTAQGVAGRFCFASLPSAGKSSPGWGWGRSSSDCLNTSMSAQGGLVPVSLSVLLFFWDLTE